MILLMMFSHRSLRLSVHTPVDPRSASPEIAQLLSLHRTVDNSQELNHHENDQNRFFEEKRLIEEELEMIRREHENYRQLIITI